MYDSVSVPALPLGGQLYAGYVDGLYANFSELEQRFGLTSTPVLVSIAVTAAHEAQVLDVERGDATPPEAPGWAVRMRALGYTPTVYCALSSWPTVRNAFADAKEPTPNYWIAAYPGNGPSLYPGSVAHQYQSAATYDTSVVADYWPGVDPAPIPPSKPKESEMIAATATGNGYVVARPTGAVFAYGDANYHGGANTGTPGPVLPAGEVIVGITLRPQNDGYWLVSTTGGVYAYGAAKYLGGPNTP